MIHIDEIIVVEGKFDKEKIKKFTDATVISTNGFSIYKNKQLISFLREASKNTGIVILTDSDSAGFRIRNYIKQITGSDSKIKNLYKLHFHRKL